MFQGTKPTGNKAVATGSKGNASNPKVATAASEASIAQEASMALGMDPLGISGVPMGLANDAAGGTDGAGGSGDGEGEKSGASQVRYLFLKDVAPCSYFGLSDALVGTIMFGLYDVRIVSCVCDGVFLHGSLLTSFLSSASICLSFSFHIYRRFRRSSSSRVTCC